ncbi:MAG: hypothetical protein J6M34_07165 [Clostridia bacterium]|nr:hypothetical protein [Clostridia bacterium]
MNRDEILDNGKRILQTVSEKACDLADAARVRIKIANLESDISLKTRRLGRLACNAMDEGVLTMDEEMQKVYNEITDLKQRIAALKGEL